MTSLPPLERVRATVTASGTAVRNRAKRPARPGLRLHRLRARYGTTLTATTPQPDPRWVRQGRTDAWIAHQLEVTVQQIEAFKRENDLAPDGEAAEAHRRRLRRRDRSPRRGRRADRRRARGRRGRRAEEEERRAAEEEAARPPRRRRAPRREDDDEDEDEDEDDDEAPQAAAAGAAAAAAARAASAPAELEGTFDHGEEGYGLWLDPAVADDPVYAEHWAGHRPVEVTIEEDQIVIRRAGEDDDGDDDDD